MEEKRFNTYLLIAIIISVVGVLVISFLLIFNIDKKEAVKKNDETTKSTVDNPDKYDYKYVVNYNYYSGDYYIYLLKDNSIKVINKVKVYKECFEQNCIVETDEVKYLEIKVDLTESESKKVIDTISSLFKDKDSNELYIDYTYDYKVLLVLNGLLANNGDLITLDDSINIKNYEEIIKNKKGEEIFKHSYDNILESSNKIVDNIRIHINGIINKDYEELVNNSKEVVDTTYNEGYDLGVNLRLSIDTIDDDEISILYTTDGSLGGVNWFILKGYVYNINNGNILEYRDNLKDRAYNEAIKSFENSELYKNNKKQLVSNYEEIIKEEMFKVGNYYIHNNNVIFIIDGAMLGFDEATAKIVDISIDRKNNF